MKEGSLHGIIPPGSLCLQDPLSEMLSLICSLDTMQDPLINVLIHMAIQRDLFPYAISPLIQATLNLDILWFNSMKAT